MARITGNGNANTLRGTSGGDVILGLGGHDVLYGEAGRDELYGGAGDDVLRGGAGDDSLQGGPGDDTYIGGDGADRFIFTDVPASGHASEYIPTYQIGDVLDFSKIDANWDRDGNQAFRWLGHGDFTGRAGELIIRHLGEGTGAYTRLYADVDGNSQADMIVTIGNGWYDFSSGTGDLIL